MNYLFLHHNFPAQFRHLAGTLAARPGNRVVFLSENRHPGIRVEGVRQGLVPVPMPRGTRGQNRYEADLILNRGEAFARAMLELDKRGFVPDVVYDHCGWGCGLFIPDIFPEAFRATYCEWFFNSRYPTDLTGRTPEQRVTAFAPERLRNHCQLDALAACDVAITPTFWQQAQYPESVRERLRVVHDGIDDRFFSPAAEPCFFLRGDRPFSLPEGTEIVSYVCRAFEPCRGFPQVMRSLPLLLEQRPDCHVVVMGEDRVAYDPPRADGHTWLEAMRAELDLDPSRIHFVGFGTYPAYLRLLRASALHLYMTRPYVLSWSLLEAMSTGCLILASDTEPVREVMEHGRNGLLTPFDDPRALARQAAEALAHRADLEPLRVAARQTVRERYSLRALLRRQLALLDERPAGR